MRYIYIVNYTTHTIEEGWITKEVYKIDNTF